MLSGSLTSPGAYTAKCSANVPMTPLALGAMPRPAAQAVLAGAAPVAAAGAAEAEDHPIADRHEALGARPEGLDHADRLVTDRRRLYPVPVAAHEVEVGVAHPGGADPHQRLVVAGDGDSTSPIEQRRLGFGLLS